MTDQLPSKDLSLRLREFDWYGPPRKGADELLNEAADEIERLQRKLETCGLECSEGLRRLAAENERLKREAAEARDLLNSEWFQRVTYKQQLRAALARIDALMLEYCPDEMTPQQRESWAANQRAAQPPPVARNPNWCPTCTKPYVECRCNGVAG